MRVHERRAIALIEEILSPWGFTCEAREGGKHMAVHARGPRGHRVKFPISGTPRDSDCQLNQIRQQVMAWLERSGMATGRGLTGERRARRKARVRSIIHRVEVAVDPDTGPARDPWAALREMQA